MESLRALYGLPLNVCAFPRRIPAGFLEHGRTWTRRKRSLGKLRPRRAMEPRGAGDAERRWETGNG